MAAKSSTLSHPSPQEISPQQEKLTGLVEYLCQASERSFRDMELAGYADMQDFSASLSGLLNREVELRARRLVRLWVEAYRRGNGCRRVGLSEARSRAQESAGAVDALARRFQSVDGRTALRRNGNLKDARRWQEFFARWGCVACGRMSVEHGGYGFCAACYTRTWKRLKEI